MPPQDGPWPLRLRLQANGQLSLWLGEQLLLPGLGLGPSTGYPWAIKFEFKAPRGSAASATISELCLVPVAATPLP